MGAVEMTLPRLEVIGNRYKKWLSKLSHFVLITKTDSKHIQTWLQFRLQFRVL